MVAATATVTEFIIIDYPEAGTPSRFFFKVVCFIEYINDDNNGNKLNK